MGCCSSNAKTVAVEGKDKPGVKPAQAQASKPDKKNKQGKDKGRNKLTFVVLGLDNAGKTTIGENLMGKPKIDAMPTLGLELQKFKMEDGQVIELYGLGGGKSIRDYWSEYYDSVHGVIYVVDSADTNRLAESATEFDKMINAPLVQGKPILVYANKQDLPKALTEAEVSNSLLLDQLETSSHHILKCVAKVEWNEDKSGPKQSDVRLMEGIHWLVDEVKKIYDVLQPRVQADVAKRKEIEKLKRAERKKKIAQAKAERAAKAAAEAEEKKSGGTTKKEKSSEDKKPASRTATPRDKPSPLALDTTDNASSKVAGGVAAASAMRSATPKGTRAPQGSPTNSMFTEPIDQKGLPGMQKSPMSADDLNAKHNFDGVIVNAGNTVMDLQLKGRVLPPLKHGKRSYSPPAGKSKLPPLKQKNRRPSF